MGSRSVKESTCSSDDVESNFTPVSRCPFHRSGKQEYGITKLPNEPMRLSGSREVSSIPKADAKGDYWVYPSEKMFWKAMVSKGWRWRKDSAPDEDVMRSIIALHNANNEATWKEIEKWEQFAVNGNSAKYSPRARIRYYMGYDLPFDRHDWIVDSCGRDLRYIIDYYDSSESNVMSAIDVRPSMTTPTGFYTRLRAVFKSFTTSNEI
ncbi:hypothetical protein ACOME3_001473 [Neoechinorhynchus agilis]